MIGHKTLVWQTKTVNLKQHLIKFKMDTIDGRVALQVLCCTIANYSGTCTKCGNNKYGGAIKRPKRQQ